MAEVRMSLKEYDELRGELNSYKELVRVLTTPNISTWDIEYYKDNVNRALSLNSQYIKDPKFLNIIRESLLSNLSAEVLNLGDLKLDSVIVNLGYIEHTEEEKATEEI